MSKQIALKIRRIGKSIATHELKPLDNGMTGLGALIVKYRTENALSQNDLAVRLGVDGQTISNIETGKTKRLNGEAMRKLAEEMKVEVAKLVEAQSKTDPRPIARSSTKAPDRAVLPSDPTAAAVHALRGLARSAVDARIAVAMFLSHSEARAVHAAMAARLKKPDVAKNQRVDLLPLVIEGKANNP